MESLSEEDEPVRHRTDVLVPRPTRRVCRGRFRGQRGEAAARAAIYCQRWFRRSTRVRAVEHPRPGQPLAVTPFTHSRRGGRRPWPRRRPAAGGDGVELAAAVLRQFQARPAPTRPRRG